MSMTINEQNKWLERNSRYGEVNENVVRSVFGNGGGSGDNTVYMDAETEFWPLTFPEGLFRDIDGQAARTIAEQLKNGKKIVVTIEKDGFKEECQLAYAEQAEQGHGSIDACLFYPRPGGSSGYYWYTDIYKWMKE